MNKKIFLLGCLVVNVHCFAHESDKTDETNKASENPTVASILGLDRDIGYGEYLASGCTTCHNIGNTNDSIPVIHGKDESYLIQALLEYKNNKRENKTMQSVASALSDEEIGSVVLYFSSLR